MTDKELMLNIIKEYRISDGQLARLAGVSREVVRTYLQDKIPVKDKNKERWIEEALIEFRSQIIENRKRLLHKTRYGYLYSNLAWLK